MTANSMYIDQDIQYKYEFLNGTAKIKLLIVICLLCERILTVG